VYVCLCNGITSAMVQEAIAGGARSTKQLAEQCGAGDVCGRCRHTLRTMIAAQTGDSGNHKRLQRRWGRTGR
jgi:bacterioferritin-associated ferredoxin